MEVTEAEMEVTEGGPEGGEGGGALGGGGTPSGQRFVEGGVACTCACACACAWRGVAWRGVAWRGVAWRGVCVACTCAWHSHSPAELQAVGRALRQGPCAHPPVTDPEDLPGESDRVRIFHEKFRGGEGGVARAAMEAEAEPRCVMGGLEGGELRIEVELPGCSAGRAPPRPPPPSPLPSLPPPPPSPLPLLPCASC